MSYLTDPEAVHIDSTDVSIALQVSRDLVCEGREDDLGFHRWLVG